MPSPTDFNVSPYYDDFSNAKNFHRIFLDLTFAVQARELTQSQTILQNQIEKFGDHMFKSGAMVILLVKFQLIQLLCNKINI